MDDILVGFGGEVKALGDGRVGGYGVTFKGEDLEGQFFEADTYFGARGGDGADCLFHHSLPIKGISEEYTDHLFSPVKAKKDEIGIFVEVVLDMANDYEKAVYGMVKAKKLGWSSGAPAHMVRYETDGKIKRWPLSEFSLTPQPAEPRNKVAPLKSLGAFEYDAETFSFKSYDPLANLDYSLTLSALYTLGDRLYSCFYRCVGGTEGKLSERVEALKTQFDTLRDKAAKVIMALSDEERADAVKVFGRLAAGSGLKAEGIDNERDFERFLRDAGFSRKAATVITSAGYKALLHQREAEDSESNDLGSCAAYARALEASLLTGVI